MLVKFTTIHGLLVPNSVKLKYFAINESNIVQNLIFAEQLNCAIIKETCMDMFIAKFDSMVYSDSFRDILVGSPDLLQELMIELRNADPPHSDDDDWGRPANDPPPPTPLTNYNVNELLRMCMKQGLDYDGTKEVLLSRIQNNCARVKDGKDNESSEEDGESSEQEEEE